MKPERLAYALKVVQRRRGCLVAAFHVKIDGADGDELQSWEVGELTDTRRIELAQEIFEAIQGDCDEAGRSKQYRLVVTAPGNANGTAPKELKRMLVKQHPDPAALEAHEQRAAGPGGDDATAQGMVAQSMRHTERAMDLLLSSQEKVIRALHQQLEALSAEVQQLRKRETDVLDLARNVYARAGSEVESERSGERLDRGIELLARYASAIGIQMGVLPEGFSLERDLAALAQTPVNGSGATGATGAVKPPLAPVSSTLKPPTKS